MKRKKSKKNLFSDLVIYLLNGAFLHTVGASGGFVIDDDGRIDESRLWVDEDGDGEILL